MPDPPPMHIQVKQALARLKAMTLVERIGLMVSAKVMTQRQADRAIARLKKEGKIPDV